MKEEEINRYNDQAKREGGRERQKKQRERWSDRNRQMERNSKIERERKGERNMYLSPFLSICRYK